MRFRLSMSAVVATLLVAEAEAGGAGAYFVEKITSVIAIDTGAGHPVVEVCEVSLSDGRTYAFRIEGIKQICWIDILSSAMGQAKRVELGTERQPQARLSYRPRVCAFNGETYTCGFLKEPVSMPLVAWVSLEREDLKGRFDPGFGAWDTSR